MRRSRPIDRLLREGPAVATERPIRRRSLFLRLIEAFGRWTPQIQKARLRTLIHKSGMAGRIRVEEIFGLKIVGLIAFGITGVLLTFLVFQKFGDVFVGHPATVGQLLYFLPLLIAFIGFFAPEFWLRRQIAARRRQILRALPDFMDLLATSVEAGLGFDMAIDRIVRRFPGPLGEEFQRYLWEVQFGRPRNVALATIAERNEIDDLRILSSALTQAELFGLPIANVLRIQAEELRDRRFQSARERAMRAPVLMIPPLALCFCPVLLLLLFVPLAIRLRNQFGGGGLP